MSPNGKQRTVLRAGDNVTGVRWIKFATNDEFGDRVLITEWVDGYTQFTRITGEYPDVEVIADVFERFYTESEKKRELKRIKEL